MRLNAFEGARRVAVVLALVWVSTLTIVWFTEDHFLPVTYQVGWPDSVPVSVGSCERDDRMAFATVYTEAAQRVAVTLCFRALKRDDGELVIPYAPHQAGGWIVGDRYSPEVKRYMDDRASNFVLPPDGVKHVNRLVWQKRLESGKAYAAIAGIGLFIGWLTVAIVGWVVRGFLGIPRGRDSRPQEQGERPTRPR